MAEITRLGGAAKAADLLAAGATRGRIRGWLRAGLIRRPRKGWYVRAGTPEQLSAAVRVGGRATCITAFRVLGLWVADDPGLMHVAVHRAACQLRSVASLRERQSRVGDAVVHWRDTEKPRRPSGSRLVEPVGVALRDALGCLSLEDVFVAAESALNLGILSAADWRGVLAGATASQRKVLEGVGPLSGSGIESLFVLGMRRIGVAVRQQVQIGPDRVDALIGDRLVVELDGATHHARHADYLRDARLVAAGYLVLRFDYEQVMYGWRSVLAAVLAVMARGDHLA